MPQSDIQEKLKQIIMENISNEQFGVAELAEESGMSRSTLLRKVQKEVGMSASQFIKQLRLEESVKLLKENDRPVSEIGYMVGFNSTSYFIKCFKEEFGYSPGEYHKQKPKVEEVRAEGKQNESKKNKPPFLFSLIILLAVFITVWWLNREPEPIHLKDKSIAILPFKNDSKDSSNVYFINGLTDAILNHLQKIKDIKVISRTTMEKYRETNKSIPEIAEELGVSYFVEGSGQKMKSQILLNVQLIDAYNDSHIWAKQYNRELNDVFKIQKEVASRIAMQIEAKITPDEQRRIEEIPTSDLIAYDFFLQGLEYIYQPSEENLKEAISLFTKAIERDENFARAYATTAMAYYYLDLFQAQKKHIEEVNYYAEKAYLIAPELSQSLVAKALSYMIKRDYHTAVTYLEKANEVNPNSAFVINYLSDFYANYLPNTDKYLEYALKGLQVDKSSNDSVANSFLYLHISNAFIQTGFIKEALSYIEVSLDYNPQNIYSHYVKAYIEYASHKDISKTNKELLQIYLLDTTRLDVVQEVAKTYYNLNDFENSYLFYKKLLDARKEQNLSLFLHENIKIAWVCRELGYSELAADLIEEYEEYSKNDQSVYQPLLMAGFYIYDANEEQALQELNKFSQVENFHIWTLFLDKEPHMQSIVDKPEFKQIMKQLETKFWNHHQELREKLEEEELIPNSA